MLAGSDQVSESDRKDGMPGRDEKKKKTLRKDKKKATCNSIKLVGKQEKSEKTFYTNPPSPPH